MIAFFGTGLLGSGFVRSFLRRGEDVNVWNRTTSKARALESAGAKVFEDPAEAARGATRIHVCLADDATVDEVLERARPGFAKDVVLVDHTTTSVHGAKDREARWTERGVAFVHAPVFMAPVHALESKGLMLVSGDPARVAPLEAALAAMTGKLENLGPKPETAAGYKLLGNMFLMFLTSGLAEMLGVAKASGLAPGDVEKLFAMFNPGASVPSRLAKMNEGNFSSPSWELTMARKDARLMLEEAERGQVPLTVLPAIAKLMDAVIAEGHGGDDWTVLAQSYLPKKS